MFGCVIAGRPLLPPSSLTQVDPTHAYFALPFPPSTINHITLFLTGDVPFPPGFGASVHFFWPGKGFQVLGMVSNEKPSAVFRVRGTFNMGEGGGAQGVFGGVNGGMQGPEEQQALLGLAIEPLDVIQAQLPASTSTALVKPAPSVADAAVLAEKMVKHLLNYLSGFTGGATGGNVMVPMNMFMKWYENFIGKIRASGGIGFLERVE
ncbi:hypothetical protein EST38_g4364 [Candolleomyces aberdarensis]|uniref:Uncharacterized protein n=1 Tax=Candolleomyces aberdarensis TaxID=2316362 RepID=A0A4Q2DR64_9AGAR|nr:hypothetical protein EST38_g4364 [Candolleomyces aberdarensis]